MVYPTVDSIEKALANAEKYKANIEQELAKINGKIEKLDAEANEYAKAANFDSFDKVSDEIVKLKAKANFYENHLASYHDGEYPQISAEDICNSWNEVSKPICKKVDKVYEELLKARDEYISKLEVYAKTINEGLKQYYGYRNYIPKSAFNRLGRPVYDFNEISHFGYDDLTNIGAYLFANDPGKRFYLIDILDNGRAKWD